MVWKLILNIIVVMFVVAFFGFNYDNTLDLNFWFDGKASLKDIPVFAALAVAYLAGFLTILPFYIKRSFKQSRLNKKIKKMEKSSERLASSQIEEKPVQTTEKTLVDTPDE